MPSRPCPSSPGATNSVKTAIDDIVPYLTRDASTIRELLHPDQGQSLNQSLAEASIPPGATTLRHRHRLSEEIYHVTHGTGRMTLGESVFAIAVGDSILIRPGTPHCVENTGREVLRILCCCAPPYAHDDTELL